MTEHTCSIHVSLAALQSQLQRSLQRSVDLTSFGLIAAERAPMEEALKLPWACPPFDAPRTREHWTGTSGSGTRAGGRTGSVKVKSA